jgi:hypothetical protein
MQKRNPNLVRSYDPSNKTMCSKCKQFPRLKYHNYCKECKNKYFKEWLKKVGGMWRYANRTKMLARCAVQRNLQRGKIKRMPCEVCGDVKSQGHHHAGYDKANQLNVKWLCKKHHDEAERILKSQLTEQPLLL